jgi:hypothetical protein
LKYCFNFQYTNITAMVMGVITIKNIKSINQNNKLTFIITNLFYSRVGE